MLGVLGSSDPCASSPGVLPEGKEGTRRRGGGVPCPTYPVNMSLCHLPLSHIVPLVMMSIIQKVSVTSWGLGPYIHSTSDEKKDKKVDLE